MCRQQFGTMVHIHPADATSHDLTWHQYCAYFFINEDGFDEESYNASVQHLILPFLPLVNGDVLTYSLNTCITNCLTLTQTSQCLLQIRFTLWGGAVKER